MLQRNVKRSAPPVCKVTTRPRRLIVLVVVIVIVLVLVIVIMIVIVIVIVIAGANSPKSIAAILHNLPFRTWQRPIDILQFG